MKVKKIVLGLFILGLSSLSSIKAQQDVEVNLSGDFVSSYVWRGIKQAGASVQPALSVGYKDFSISAWGSTDIAGNDKKEVDFTLGYSVSRFNINLTDYWWDGEYSDRYFSCPRDGNSGHLLEVGLSYTFSESLPLSLSWNTFVLGEGNKKTDGKNSFSTYIEASYPFTLQNVDFSASVGLLPWKSTVYGSDMNGFKVTVIKLGATKEIQITDKFKLPLFAHIIANPAVEDIHFVLGLTIK